MRFHSSCLFQTGQSLLVDFRLCASTRLVFLTLVNRCWRTLTCALRRYDRQALLVDFDLCVPTLLVFFDIGQSLLVDFDLCFAMKRSPGTVG